MLCSRGSESERGRKNMNDKQLIYSQIKDGRVGERDGSEGKGTCYQKGDYHPIATVSF